MARLILQRLGAACFTLAFIAIVVTSVFFGGFFLPLNLMFSWVRGVSYALPVTYGAVNLRDVMLRGAAPDWTFVLGPTILGLALNAVALYGLRRQMRRG